MRGPLLVTTAAFIFAGANATATAIYRRGGTVCTTFLLRCVMVYIFNGVLVACREGRAASLRVLLLRTGRTGSSCGATARSLVGAFMGVTMNVSFLFLTFGDAFTVFKGTDTISTVIVSRVTLGHSERLATRELACGGLTFVGIILIAQPPLLFGGGVRVVSAAGVAIAIVAGVGSAGFNVLTRALSRKGGPHEGHLPPPMLLSYFMCVVFACVGAIALLAETTGLSAVDGWEWTRMARPRHTADWLLLLLYGAGILTGQLLMAAGYRTTRAGVGAFLALTELAFAYLLDVLALHEPTSALGGLGTAIVFGSAFLTLRQPRRADTLAGQDAQQQEGVQEPAVVRDDPGNELAVLEPQNEGAEQDLWAHGTAKAIELRNTSSKRAANAGSRQ